MNTFMRLWMGCSSCQGSSIFLTRPTGAQSVSSPYIAFISSLTEIFPAILHKFECNILTAPTFYSTGLATWPRWDYGYRTLCKQLLYWNSVERSAPMGLVWWLEVLTYYWWSSFSDSNCMAVRQKKKLLYWSNPPDPKKSPYPKLFFAWSHAKWTTD